MELKELQKEQIILSKSKLFVPNHIYKPFTYPWAYELWEAQQKIHWLADEVPMADDVKDWKTNITKAEKSLLTHIFRFFTQADIEVHNCYEQNYGNIFEPIEVKMMLTAIQNTETIHVQAYAHLIDTLEMPESTYAEFLNHKAMRDKYEYYDKFNVKDSRNIALTLAGMGAFTEGIQLFASFAILLNFPRFGKMKGMGQIITWSVRDETLHFEAMAKLFTTLVADEPHIVDGSFYPEIYAICSDIVGLEDRFVDLAFSDGGIEGLKATEVKQYVRYIADRRLALLGMNPMYNIEKNPLPWLDEILNGVDQVNFFENRVTDYSKAATDGEWDDIY
jgi:ribonucleoside-diphosphate reductase beta chain